MIRGRRGFTPENSKRAHFEGHRRLKHHQNFTKEPKRRKNENCGGTRKKTRSFGPPPSGPKTFPPHPSHPLGPPNSLKIKVSTKTPTLGSKIGIFQENFKPNSDFPTISSQNVSRKHIHDKQRTTAKHKKFWDQSNENDSQNHASVKGNHRNEIRD